VLRIARVVVDVTGVDKPFDYLIPDELAPQVVVGARVRVPLHRREVPGWVMEVLDADRSDVDVGRLLPVRKVTSIGPAPDVVELAEWAAVRWASRRRPFFVAASPTKRVPRLGARQRRNVGGVGDDSSVDAPFQEPGGLVVLGPASDPMPVVRAAMALGPTLVVVPTLSRVRRIAAECRRIGRTTATYPDEWVVAASGVDVVIGARSAVWATVPELAALVVVDEHDDALQEERAPTWHARDVAIERARRGGIPCILASAVPTLAARRWAGTRVVDAPDARAWPPIRVVDRNADERWASSLVTSALIELLRQHDKRVVCVLNVKGRARAVACDSCRSVARCEHCDAGLSQPAKDRLACPRCGIERPVVCLGCGSQKFRSIRAGISRLRDEMEAAAGRVVQEVTPATESLDPGASVFVGTEAVLHRLDRADSVVFLDIDAELLAPRYRASEQALDLIAHGARLVAPTTHGGGGEVVLQTAVPNHELIVGLVAGDLSGYVAAETARRERLRLPPFGALAEISGPGTKDAVTALSASLLVEVAAREDSALVRAVTWDDLSSALATLPKTKQRIRVSVDPARV
jgi:primosomal protein N' (replication factor Y)